MMIELRPIGIIHTPYKEQRDTPIQGVFGLKSQGTVEVFKEFADGLQDIEGFDYIILLYLFHRSQGFALQVRPYLDDKLHGLFTTRAPRRPNPIGFSVVRLLEMKKNILSISEIDILDGTPLLDIKPYVPRFDARLNCRIGWLEGKLEEGQDFGADERFRGDWFMNVVNG